MFKILIVDPNDPFRQSLKKVLMNHFPFIDVQEASDGTEGMDKVRTPLIRISFSWKFICQRKAASILPAG